MLDYRYDTFYTLAKQLNYTRAAEELNITQPAVTKHIQSLQAELGVNLFIYEHRELSLTPSGEYLFQQLDQLMPELHTIYRTLTQNSQLKIAVGRTIGECFLFQHDTAFSAFFDREDIELSIDTTDVILPKLFSNNIDIAIVAGEIDEHKFTKTHFLNQRLVGICSPLNNEVRTATTLNELTHSFLILRERGAGVIQVLKRVLAQSGLSIPQFKKHTHIANTDAIKKMVIQNKGISFLFDCSVKEELDKGILLEIPLRPITSFAFYLVTKKGREREPFIKQAIKELKKTI